MVRLKIVHVCAIFPPDIGGPAVQAADLVDWQHQSAAYKPFVITFGQHAGRTSYHGVPVYHIGKYLFLPGPLGTLARQGSAFIHLLNLCRHKKPDVIHVHDLRVLGLVSGLVARLVGIPSVIKYSGDWVYEAVNTAVLKAQIPQVYTFSLSARVLTFIQRLVLSMHRYVWVVSRYQQQILEDYLHISAQKIVFMPNYVNLQSSPAGKRPLHQPLTILYAARPVPWKGLDRLPELARQLRDLPIRFLIAGPQSVTFKRGDFQAKHQFFCLGPVPPQHMPDLYAYADVFLSLSVYEPFGIALLQAQAAGLLVIAPNLGGIPEVVKDSVTGYLFPPDNIGIAATKLRAWLKNTPRQITLRRQAVISGRHYDLSNSASGMRRFYRHICPSQTL